MQIKVSSPGPRNLSYLPIDLMAKICADRAEGAEVHVKYVGGGSVALQDILLTNSDFAITGVPAMLSQQASGEKVTLLAAVDDLPVFVLMVRADLKKQIKNIADLKGRAIGVNTSSMTSKTTSQQLTELLLKSAGVALDTVRIVPVGQSWDEQSSVLISRAVDAIMGDEPFASRLRADNRVYFLMNLADPAAASKISGAGFLHAALATSPEVLEREPQKAEKMVAILRRTLRWIATHTPEQIAAALEIKNPQEKASLLAALRTYKRLYSPDGRLSSKQLKETELFFHKTAGDNPAAQRVTLESMVFDKWAGRKD
jgi:NitT/TauT family transport system substrate-binding protein